MPKDMTKWHYTRCENFNIEARNRLGWLWWTFSEIISSLRLEWNLIFSLNKTKCLPSSKSKSLYSRSVQRLLFPILIGFYVRKWNVTRKTKPTVGFFQFGRFPAISYGRVIAKVWQLDARTLWARDATVASEQTADFVFRAGSCLLTFVDRRRREKTHKLYASNGTWVDQWSRGAMNWSLSSWVEIW